MRRQNITERLIFVLAGNRLALQENSRQFADWFFAFADQNAAPRQEAQPLSPSSGFRKQYIFTGVLRYLTILLRKNGQEEKDRWLNRKKGGKKKICFWPFGGSTTRSVS